MTKDEIASVMTKIPELNCFGIGLHGPGPPLTVEQRRAQLEQAQRELLGMTNECTAVCNWLKNKAPIKAVNKRHSSYRLKDLAEKEIGYVMNGAFICAAVFSGFDFQPDPPNAYFNIAERSLKSKRRPPAAPASGESGPDNNPAANCVCCGRDWTGDQA